MMEQVDGTEPFRLLRFTFASRRTSFMLCQWGFNWLDHVDGSNNIVLC